MSVRVPSGTRWTGAAKDAGAAVGALFVEPTTREQENEAWHLAGRIYGYWLVGGLALFPVLGMTRTLVVHLTTMIVAPVALFALVMLSAAR
ncbi:hypothetical protein ACFU53_18220 [Streptomyces sp. NPDC057474]|uniref:hypothetical protein n=1 Tax=Streptomyces sp. NPDC057474 TaxID=3346144 RepID=UPI0036ABB45C